MAKISPLSFVDPKAQLDTDVEVGPFCVVGPDVVIGAGTKLMNNVTIIGHSVIGRENLFFPNCVIGAAPQDKKYKGASTRVEIGDNNQIRESVTIHLGTEKGGGITRVGSNGLYMVNTHIGHDCQFGNNIIIANNVMIAGHVVCGNNVAMMGGVGIHHFVTVGDYVYIGGYARIHHDVPPYLKVDGADQIRGVNAVGMRRGGFSEPDIEMVESVVRKLFYKEKPLAVALQEFHLDNGISPHVRGMIEFIQRRTAGRHGRHLEGLRKS